MKKAYLGIDIGSISTKAVVINEDRQIVAQAYLMTECKPIETVTKLLDNLKSQMEEQAYEVVTVGTTGSARKLIGAMTEAAVVKNEITAHAIGTTSLYPEVRTIFEIGGQDSKIILIENGMVVDYAMNTLCAAGTGSFLASQAHRIGVEVEDFGKLALTSSQPTRLAARCTVFAESDLVHKAQMGHQTEDIIAGLCHSVVRNYLNNVGKGKKILPPIVFQGGVSKNQGVIKAFEEITGHKILVDKNGHLTGALGTAILAQKSKEEKPFSFAITEMNFTTKGVDCDKCANSCEIMCVYRDHELIDAWGNKCEKGSIKTS